MIRRGGLHGLKKKVHTGWCGGRCRRAHTFVLLPKQALAQAVATACNPGPVVPIDGLEQFNAVKFKSALPNPLDPSNVYNSAGSNALGQPKFTWRSSRSTSRSAW